VSNEKFAKIFFFFNLPKFKSLRKHKRFGFIKKQVQSMHFFFILQGVSDSKQRGGKE